MDTLRLCAWHCDRGQGVLPLVNVSHGICEVCFELVNAEVNTMARKRSASWVHLYIEGAWQRRAGQGWCPDLFRAVHGGRLRQEVVPTGEAWPSNPYILLNEGQEVFQGDLAECLEAANGYDT